MEQKQNCTAPGAATDEPAPPVNQEGSDLTGFEPVPLRYRQDGLTPEKQREYVEALADTGVARAAAARIGVSEQAINRIRRRSDARAFDLACEAAQRFGARRLRSIAYERAIEGTVKRHYYHGELRSEEVVFDNRLLVYLLGKTAHLAEPPAEAQAVAENWEGWMEAVELGLPEPPAPEPEHEAEKAQERQAEMDPFTGEEVWEEPDGWWTRFPPPAGFEGEEEGRPGEFGYKRTLSAAELAVLEEEEAEERAETIGRDTALRDLYFGFDGGSRDQSEAQVFSPREAETNETSGPPGLARTEVSDSADPAAGDRADDLADPFRPGPRIRSL